MLDDGSPIVLNPVVEVPHSRHGDEAKTGSR
jgi:hypothetical protein